MDSTFFRPMRRAALAALTIAALAAAGSASAQYIWIGPNGVKQYSDSPPPASVPASKIIQQPGSPSGRTGVTPDAPPANDPASAASPSAAPRSLAQQNADFNKRRAEQEEKDRKAAEQQKTAADRARNCDRARTYQRTLESGDRISQVDKNGERAYMGDAQRARESAETKRMLDECAKGG